MAYRDMEKKRANDRKKAAKYRNKPGMKARRQIYDDMRYRKNGEAMKARRREYYWNNQEKEIARQREYKDGTRVKKRGGRVNHGNGSHGKGYYEEE